MELRNIRLERTWGWYKVRFLCNFPGPVLSYVCTTSMCGQLILNE